MDRTPDRRQFVRTALAGAAIGIAGCSGGGSSSDQTTTSDGTNTEAAPDGSDETVAETSTESGMETTTNNPTMPDGPKGLMPQFQADSANTGVVSGASPPSGPSVDWQYPSGGGGFSIMGPSYVDGVLYAAHRASQSSDSSQKLLALNATTGEVLAERTTSTGMIPTYHEGTLYVTDQDGLRALSPTDLSVQWTAGNAETLNAGELTPAGDTIFGLGSNKNGETLVRAVSTADGSVRWEQKVTFSGFLKRSTVAVDGNNVYASGESLDAFARSDGSTQWSKTVEGKFSNAPTVVNGTVYAGTTNGRLVGYNASDGSEVVNVQTSSPFGIDSSFAHNDGVLLAGPDALDLETNEIAWSLEESFVSGAAVAGDKFIAIRAGDQPVAAVNRSDGSVAWRAGPDLEDTGVNGGAMAFGVGSRVYAGYNGKIVALS